MTPSFSTLENDINTILIERYQALIATDSPAKKQFASIFTYENNENAKGQGEKPSWTPNEAYISTLEWLWQPVEDHLATMNLTLTTPWRQSFADSREYEDYETVHRRIFFGQLTDKTKGYPITSFMLTSTHDHRKFDKPMRPIVQIAPEIVEA